MEESLTLFCMGAAGALLLEIFWLRSQYGKKTPERFHALMYSKTNWLLSGILIIGSGFLTFIIMDGPPHDHLALAGLNGAAIRTFGKDGLSAFILNKSHNQGSSSRITLREILS